MTDRYAVFGDPVEHSLSPLIHRSFAEQTGQAMAYTRERVTPDQFTEAVKAFFAAGGGGLNITLPHKIAAFEMATELTERARRAGAVNTLRACPERGILGENTDGVGLVRDLVDNLAWPLRGRRVLVLGAGGAVRGVMGPLLAAGPGSLIVANRTVERARALVRSCAATSGALDYTRFEDLDGRQFDLVINGTSASLAGDLPPLPRQIVAPGGACYDMMYAAKDTVFLAWARRHGAARVADGLGMLVEQAAESFRQWRGVAPETAPVIRQLRTMMIESSDVSG